MFKFGFDVENDGDLMSTDDLTNLGFEESQGAEAPGAVSTITSTVVSFKDLLSKLPPLISYSPLAIPLGNGERLTIARRDLFDARFQLISEGKSEGSDAAEKTEADTVDGTVHADGDGNPLRFVDAPSDLVRGVYEGGLKTWECSLDLVGYLYRQREEIIPRFAKGRRILEIGCGTGLPSLYVLRDLFVHGSDPEHETQIHFQDYNLSVLELVTVPNIVLAWYMSSLSTAYRSSEEESEPPLPPADPTEPGELPITPALVSALLTSLEDANITLRLFYGSWETFDVQAAGGKYDLVLTSETIYQTESLGSLVELLRAASLGPAEQPSSSGNYMCLVAAKVLYFGVGGGVTSFVKAVEEPKTGLGGRVEVVSEHKDGVGRQIMQVVWQP